MPDHQTVDVAESDVGSNGHEQTRLIIMLRDEDELASNVNSNIVDHGVMID